MADHIPFITSDDGCQLVETYYSDSDIVRIPLDRAAKFLPLPVHSKVWLDPCVDGMDNLERRRSHENKSNSWFEFMKGLPHFETLAAPSFHARPVSLKVSSFVGEILGRCAAYKPAWITVPQLPLVNTSARNRINRAMAAAAGKWKGSRRSSARLILPLVFTHQAQVNLKTSRNPKVEQAQRCYHEAQADGFWVVDKSLADDTGSPTLRDKRFPGMINLLEELNERVSSKIRIAGPYWVLNLVLWARNLVDYPAIGVGSGYQYFLAGSMAKQPVAKVMLRSLRRRAGVGDQFKAWLDAAIAKLGRSHPAHAEYSEIKRQYVALSGRDRAKEQVAALYKQWFDIIAAAPKAGRSLALFQDLSAAYALGKSLSDLQDLQDTGPARRPEAIAESLMLSCL